MAEYTSKQYLKDLKSAYEQEKKSGNDHSERGSYTSAVNARLSTNQNFVDAYNKNAEKYVQEQTRLYQTMQTAGKKKKNSTVYA